MTGSKILTVVVAATLLISCVGRDEAVVSGTFSGVNQKTVYLDHITTSKITLIDSVTTDEKGGFKFKFKTDAKTPSFYNVRHRGQTIPLLLVGGDRVKINSLGNLSRNYLVEGSEGSTLIKELNQTIVDARSEMDSLTLIYNRINEYDTEARMDIIDKFSQIYVRQKQAMIRFIVNHATSLSSVYALYQHMPNGEGVFGGREDMPYFQMVYDSLNVRYPLSPNVISLGKDLERLRDLVEFDNKLSDARGAGVSYPDITLPDMYGNKIRLKTLKDKVILLDFWAAEHPGSRMYNAELMDVYGRYFQQGFEIYQVSLDTSKSLWVNAVQEQKLPWISVCDFMGASSSAAGTYNIKKVPANFLIDKQGRIVARDISPEELVIRLNQLL